jgi:hypothetical protein
MEKEGRYDQEMQELESFFKRTYPKTPLLHHKMVNRYITDYGIDGYRRYRKTYRRICLGRFKKTVIMHLPIGKKTILLKF